MKGISNRHGPRAGRHDGRKSPVKGRSRSPSRDGTGSDSRRRHRERSRSRSRKETSARHDESRNGDDTQGHWSGHSPTGHRHHHHHYREHRDEDSDKRRDRDSRSDKERGRPSRADHPHDHDRRDPSAAQWGNDHWDDRNNTSGSGSRYSSTHHCIDSVLKRQPLGTGAISPSPTPPSSQTTRLLPPRTGQHYTSHSCHDAAHIDSPIRSTTTHSSATDRHRPRRRRSPLPPHHEPTKPVTLPHAARPLSRWDFAAFEPLLAHYLEQHKRINIADLDEESVRDRWKAFVAKWNAGELERRWYEPEMFLRVVRMRTATAEEARVRTAVVAPGDIIVMTPPPTGASYAASGMGESVVDSVMTGCTTDTVAESQDKQDDDDDDDDDEYAPPLPPSTSTSTIKPRQPSSSTTTTAKPGPTIPSLQDLELRRTLETEARASSLAAHRLLRRADRAVQKARLDDVLPPRAEPGTRERKLEKKRLVTESNREFAAAREVGGDVEVGEKELLGGGEAGEDEYKRMLEGMRNRKTEREVRKEEERRAKGVEREERIREARAREEEKLGVLREMARQRFG